MTDPTPPAGSLVERGRALLRDLAMLGEERVSRLAVVEERHHAELRGAEDRREAAVAAARDRARRIVDEATRSRDAIVSAARSRAADRASRADRTWSSEREALEEKAERNATEARKKLEESVWLAETVFEAGEREPEQRYRVLEKSADAARTEIAGIVRIGRDRVGQFRQTAILEEAGTAPPPPETAGWPPSEEGLALAIEATRAAGFALHRLALPRLFKGAMLPILAILVLGGVSAGVAFLRDWAVDGAVLGSGGGTLVVFTLAAIGIFVLARRRVRRAWRRLDAVARAGLALADRAIEEAAARRTREEREHRETRDRDVRRAREQWQPVIDEIEERRARRLARLADRAPKVAAEIERRAAEAIEAAEAACAEACATAERDAAAALARAEQEDARDRAAADARHREERERLEARWRTGIDSCEERHDAIAAEAAPLVVPWDDPAWETWDPPRASAASVPFGTVAVDRRAIPGSVGDDPAFATRLPERFDLPATLDFPDRCSLLVVTDGAGREEAVDLLRATMLRLLVLLPPGKVRFTIIDPVALGQGFADFMHLADHDEALVSGRIWTEPRHVEQRLTDVTEHMENVIQTYLRNEFASIADYNERAGEIAEPYRFVVISDLPTNLSETAAKRLASITASGARCGVFTLLHLDRRAALPPGIAYDDLAARSTVVEHDGDVLRWRDPAFAGLPFRPERLPAESRTSTILHRVGAASKDASRVEVPFSVVAPPAGSEWSRDASAAITVPLGRCGATKLQELVLGPGTSQHALLAGKTGSGKSTLLHVIVTNVALWYAPDEVQLFLVDFKKGVEFKTYATQDLPHALAVAVESDREFGLSVLHRIDAELKRRGDLYRDAGVQDLAGFRRARPGEPMPRVLLVIDEFQELFVEDDKIGQDAALLLDRIVRQGRAFGIHCLLGSQTLGGAYTLARSTIGQMQIRIALQCSESDSYLILSDDNAAARLLARPGEAIYNDAGGRIEGNSPFQIVWLPDATRDERLAEVRTLRRDRGWERPEPLIVFEGNAPAEVERNHLLAAALAAPAPVREAAPRIHRAWLGEAIAIKGPTEAAFRRQSGSNLLVVGQQDEPALAMTTAAIVALAAQCDPGPGFPRIMLLDGTPADHPAAGALERLVAALPIPTRVVAWREVEEAIAALGDEVERRMAADAAAEPPCFLVVHGLQRFRMLRATDDFSFSSDPDAPPSADKRFGTILRDGPTVGVHAIAWCDTATNIGRTLERQGLREFALRVLFQMSATDSTHLIDAPAASNLGMRRALFHDEESGVLEKFRPYAPLRPAWVEAAIARLEDRAPAVTAPPAAPRAAPDAPDADPA